MILDQVFSAYILIYLIIPAIFLFNVKPAGRHETYLSIKNTENLKGIAITVIVIHHLAGAIQNPGLLTPFLGLGYLGVTIFLFLSGYGLTFSYLKKADYAKDFFAKRIFRICFPFVLLNIVHLMISSMAYNNKYTVTELLFFTTGIKLVDGTMWYIYAIFFWYGCFFILFKYFKTNVIEMLIFAAGLLYFVFCYSSDFGKFWFDSAFAFPTGVVLCLRREFLINFIKRHFNYSAFILLCLFAFFFAANHGRDSFSAVFVRSMASVMFVLVICLFMYKVDIQGNKIMSFLGSISFEIYLIHSKLLGLKLISVNNHITLINIIFYFVLSIFLALIVNKFNLFINSNINKYFLKRADNNLESSNAI